MWYVRAEHEAAQRAHINVDGNVNNSSNGDDNAAERGPATTAACSLATEKAAVQNESAQRATPKWRPRYLIQKMESDGAGTALGHSAEDRHGSATPTTPTERIASTTDVTATSTATAATTNCARVCEVGAHGSLNGSSSRQSLTATTSPTPQHNGDASPELIKMPSAATLSTTLLEDTATLHRTCASVTDSTKSSSQWSPGHATRDDTREAEEKGDETREVRTPSWILVPRAHGVNEALLCLLDASELVAEAEAEKTTTDVASGSLSSPLAALSGSPLSSSTFTTTAQLILSDSLAMSSPKSVRQTTRVTRRKVRLLVRTVTKMLGPAVGRPITLKLHPDSAGGTYMVQAPKDDVVASPKRRPLSRAVLATAPPTPALRATATATINNNSNNGSTGELDGSMQTATTATAAGHSSHDGGAGSSPSKPGTPAPSTSSSAPAAVVPLTNTAPAPTTTALATLAVFKPRDEEIGQIRNPHGNRASDRDAVFRPGTGSRREMLAYCLDHDHLAGVPPTLEVIAQSAASSASSPAATRSINLNAEGSPTAGASASPGTGDDDTDGAGQATDTARVGSLQSFVPDCVESADVLPGEFDVEEVQAIAIFDIRVLNGDRHGGNILVTPHCPSRRWYPGRRHRGRHRRHLHSDEDNETKNDETGVETCDATTRKRSASCSSSASSSSSSTSSVSCDEEAVSDEDDHSGKTDNSKVTGSSCTDHTRRTPHHNHTHHHHHHHRPQRSPQQPSSSTARRHLVPIDHSYICPSGYADPDFEWLAWPQSKAPFTPRLLSYIRRLSPETDAALVRAALLPRSSMQTLSPSHGAMGILPESTLATHPSVAWHSPSTPASPASPGAEQVTAGQPQVHTIGSPASLRGRPIPILATSVPRSPQHGDAFSSSSFGSLSLPHSDDGVGGGVAAAVAAAAAKEHVPRQSPSASNAPNVRSALNRKMKDKRLSGPGLKPFDATLGGGSQQAGGALTFPSTSRASVDGDVSETRERHAEKESGTNHLTWGSDMGDESDDSREKDQDTASTTTTTTTTTATTSTDNDDEDDAVASGDSSTLTLSIPDGVTGAHAAFYRTFSAWHPSLQRSATRDDVSFGGSGQRWQVLQRGYRGSHRARGGVADLRGLRTEPNSTAVTPRDLDGFLRPHVSPPPLLSLGASRQSDGVLRTSQNSGDGGGGGGLGRRRGMRRAQSAVTLSFAPSSPLAIESPQPEWPADSTTSATTSNGNSNDNTDNTFAALTDRPPLSEMTSPMMTLGHPMASSVASSATARREVSFAELVTTSLTLPQTPLKRLGASPLDSASQGAAHAAATGISTAPELNSLCATPTHTQPSGMTSVPEMASLYSADLTTDTEAADAAAEVVQCTTLLLKIAALEFDRTAREIGELCRRPRITAASFLESVMEAARDEVTWRLDAGLFERIVREQLADANETSTA